MELFSQCCICEVRKFLDCEEMSVVGNSKVERNLVDRKSQNGESNLLTLTSTLTSILSEVVDSVCCTFLFLHQYI